MSTEKFISSLFNDNEHGCFTSNNRGTSVIEIKKLDLNNIPEFFCINPLDGEKDNVPVKDYHSADIPRRASCNVTEFRNILIEFDKLELTQQLNFVREVGMPFTSCVYSGNKSYHFIISLEESVVMTEYKRLQQAIHKALDNKADKSTKDACRLSRMANAVRKDSGKVQSLEILNSRVKNSILIDWLNAKGALLPEHKVANVKNQNNNNKVNKKSKNGLNIQSVYFLQFGAKDGDWNNSLFVSALDHSRNGYSIEYFIQKAQKITGYLYGNDIATIKSAYSYKNKP